MFKNSFLIMKGSKLVKKVFCISWLDILPRYVLVTENKVSKIYIGYTSLKDEGRQQAVGIT